LEFAPVEALNALFGRVIERTRLHTNTSSVGDYEQNPRHRRASCLRSRHRDAERSPGSRPRSTSGPTPWRMGEAALRRASAALAVELGRIEDAR
jgi:hypothetical protein